LRGRPRTTTSPEQAAHNGSRKVRSLTGSRLRRRHGRGAHLRRLDKRDHVRDRGYLSRGGGLSVKRSCLTNRSTERISVPKGLDRFLLEESSTHDGQRLFPVPASSAKAALSRHREHLTQLEPPSESSVHGLTSRPCSASPPVHGTNSSPAAGREVTAEGKHAPGGSHGFRPTFGRQTVDPPSFALGLIFCFNFKGKGRDTRGPVTGVGALERLRPTRILSPSPERRPAQQRRRIGKVTGSVAAERVEGTSEPRSTCWWTQGRTFEGGPTAHLSCHCSSRQDRLGVTQERRGWSDGDVELPRSKLSPFSLNT